MWNYTIYVLLHAGNCMFFPHFRVIVFKQSEYSHSKFPSEPREKVKNVFFAYSIIIIFLTISVISSPAQQRSHNECNEKHSIPNAKSFSSENMCLSLSILFEKLFKQFREKMQNHKRNDAYSEERKVFSSWRCLASLLQSRCCRNTNNFNCLKSRKIRRRKGYLLFNPKSHDD